MAAKRLKVMILLLLLAVAGCSPAKYKPGYVTRFHCSDYLASNQLECMEETARQCSEEGMSREEARFLVKRCYQHSILYMVEQTYCLDDALDLYYDPVEY